MTLDEWGALTPDERNSLRRDWNPGGGLWVDLLAEACQRFRAKYGTHPKINHIGHSLWFSNSAEPAITVTTAFWPSQLLEEIPDRFATFAVRQEPIEGMKHHYLSTWTRTVGNLLGWDEAKTVAWATHLWGEYLDGKEGGVLYHDPPGDYVASLLIRELLPGKLQGLDLVALEHRLEEAIDPNPLATHPYQPAKERERVANVLADYQVALPEIRAA